MQLKTLPSEVDFDRCELVTTLQSAKEFIESLLEQLLLILCHSITATLQSVFLKEVKCNPGEVNLWFCVTAQNSFVLQDEAQGFRWNSAQVTMHPFVTYFRKVGSLNTGHENLVMI
jgi:hypothetical protein